MKKNMVLRMGTALAVLLLLISAADPRARAFADEGMWSKQAHSIPRGRDFRVPSPDRKRTVLIRELALIVVEGGAPVPGIEGYTVLLPAEIAWAPDSKAFVITSNEGGSDEAWFVTAYVLEYDRVNYYDVTVEAAVRFRELLQCTDEGEPAFAAVKWLKESKNLLIVAEAPARWQCPDAGRLLGFIVEVPSGKVLSEIPAKKLSEDWGEYLGQRIIRRLPR